MLLDDIFIPTALEERMILQVTQALMGLAKEEGPDDEEDLTDS
jgi:hypothetical protein